MSRLLRYLRTLALGFVLGLAVWFGASIASVRISTADHAQVILAQSLTTNGGPGGSGGGIGGGT